MLSTYTAQGLPPHENLRFRPYASYPQSVRDSDRRLIAARFERDRQAAAESFVRMVLGAAGLPVVEDEVSALALAPERLYLEHVETILSRVSDWTEVRPLVFSVPSPLSLLAEEPSRPVSVVAADASAPASELAAALAAARLEGSDPTAPDLVAVWDRLSPAYRIPLIRSWTEGTQDWFFHLHLASRRSRRAAA